MKKLSRLSFIVMIFSVSFLMASCAVPAKTGKTMVKRSGESQNTKMSIEERLDAIEIKLQKIQNILGITDEQKESVNEFTLTDKPSSQNMGKTEDASDSITFSDGNILTSEDDDTPDELFSQEEQEDSSEKNNSLTARDASPNLLYKKARTLLLDKKFKDAEKEFDYLAKRYPSHPLAVNALYWMGECRYSIKDYKGAIVIFKQLVEKYPNGRKVPDALLKTAYAYISINDTDNAHEYLKKVVMQFPFSPAGEKAEKKLQSFR
ncbi:MAG: tol-pal system protein YbgF [Desulfamplus sp.]|nr:tol-pal system protein YbgF [Desulfamplus sp.]